MYLGFLEGVKLKNIMVKAIFVRQTKRIGSFCLTLILIVTLSVNNCRFMIEKFPEKQVPMILDFLKGIAANNNRPWFLSHREEYNEVRTLFEAIASQFIARLSEIDETVRFLSVKDCTYRFYRDTRFSLDKSPYKRHLGIYVAAKGKKSYHGGYYLHFEPGHCMFAVGCYCLPTNILKVVRQVIVDNVNEFRCLVENETFKSVFGNRLTMTPLKVMPAGLPRDFAHPEYVKCKDYLVWTDLEDRMFCQPNWMDEIISQASLAKPFLDFINDVVDDYI